MHFYNEFVPITDIGKRLYQLMINNEYYTNIIAANDILADKMMQKFVKEHKLQDREYRLEYHSTIRDQRLYNPAISNLQTA